MVDWKTKLTSRKFWAAIASFAAMLVVAFGGGQAQATQITALIMAGATVVAYIVGEGLVDAANAGATTVINGNVSASTDATAPATSDGKTDTPAANAPQTDAHPESGAVAPDTTGAK